MKLLSAQSEKTLLDTFEKIMYGSLVQLPMGKVKMLWGNRFSLKLTHNIFNDIMRDGLIVNGFYTDGEGDTYYIRDIYEINSGLCTKTGKYKTSSYTHQHYEEEENIDEYQILELNWFTQDTPHKENLATTTPVLTVLQRFYDSPDHIKRLHTHVLNYGGKMPFGRPFDEYYTHKKFNAISCCFDNMDLKDYISKLGNKNNTLIFCNFINETDPLSLAQAGYTRVIASLLKLYFKHIKVEITDIVIVDQTGHTAYYKEYKEYYAQNSLGKDYKGKSPVPFTMMFGHIPKKSGDQTELPLIAEGRLLDFDLFYKCELASEYDDRKQMRHNVASNTNKIMKYAAAMNTITNVGLINYLGRVEKDVSSTITRLSDTAVVLLVNGESASKEMNVAVGAVASAILNGYPNVVIVQTDTLSEERPLGVFCREEACQYSYRSPDVADFNDLVAALYNDILEYHADLGKNTYDLGRFV